MRSGIPDMLISLLLSVICMSSAYAGLTAQSVFHEVNSLTKTPSCQTTH